MKKLKDIFPFEPKKTEFKFWILYTLFIIYGSLYPFKFSFNNFPVESRNIISFLFCNFNFDTSLGDILTNFLLFIPFGFLGVRSMRSPFNPPYYTFIITLCCIPIAHGLQLVQFFVKGRVPSLMDTLFNILGCFIAGAFGSVSRFRFVGGKRGLELWKSMPFLLMVLWIAFNLLPFVPTLDFGEIKNSLKPLLLHPKFDFLISLQYTISWLLFYYMYKEHTDRFLNLKLFTLVILFTLVARIFIETRVLGLPHVVGGALSLIFIKTFPQRSLNPRLLFTLLLIYLTLSGLWPFKFSLAQRNDFHLLPFYGFLEGHLYITAYISVKKAFYYGCLIWTLEHSKVKLGRATFLCVSWALALEIAQIWFLDHTPETTDPLIMLLMAWWIKKNRPSHDVKMKVVYTGPERRRNRLTPVSSSNDNVFNIFKKILK